MLFHLLKLLRDSIGTVWTIEHKFLTKTSLCRAHHLAAMAKVPLAGGPNSEASTIETTQQWESAKKTEEKTPPDDDDDDAAAAAAAAAGGGGGGDGDGDDELLLLPFL